MDGFLQGAYPWIKALHIISVMAWMAGMLYLPRLYVYHADAATGSELSETLKIMERRLLRAIINPAMIATVIFGAAMALIPGVIDWSAGWVYVKGVLLFLMFGMHGMLSRWRRDFEADGNRYSARTYRYMNEIPTLLLIGIVIMVVVRPF